METGRFSERCRRTTGRGFTFVEIMIALVIFGLLLTTALPAYRDWIAAQQLANHAHFIADTLAIARSAAIRHGYRVNLCKPATAPVQRRRRLGAGLVTVRR